MGKKLFILTSSLLMLMTVSQVHAAQLNALTQQASEQFAKGNLSAAVELQEKELKQNPKDWLSHASMSFYAWHEGNIIKSSEEGETAVKLAPESYLALSNLAAIKEGLDDPASAIPLYERASKVEPGNVEAHIGLARCKNKLGQPDECTKMLSELGRKEQQSFNWYYEIADTLLRCEKPLLAAPVAEKCVPLAKSADEIEKSSILSLMCLMQTGQFAKAEALQTEVFNKYSIKEMQLYVRTAISMLRENNPEGGKKLLETATRELKNPEDSDAFYRLGKAFEQKTINLADQNLSTPWLELSEKAFSNACQLGRSTKNYIALAGVYSAEGKKSEMDKALKTVLEIDNSDLLAKYLLSRLQNSAAQSQDAPKLEEVELTIANLNCGCHVGKVVNAMTELDGVAYSYIPANIKPYKGILIIDRNKIDAKTVFEKTTAKVKQIYASMVPPLVPDFGIVKTSNLSSISQAIVDAQNIQYGSITDFFVSFKSVMPTEPVKALATKADNRM